MNKTGHGATITFTTGGFNLLVIDFTPPGFEGEDVSRPHLGLPKGSVTPSDPGDLLESTPMVVEVEHDEAYEPAYLDPDELIITYPVPDGLTNGATDTHQGAYIMGYQPGPMQTNGRRQATITVKVQDAPAKVAAS